MFEKLKFRWKITIAICLVVLLALACTGFLTQNNVIHKNIEPLIGKRLEFSARVASLLFKGENYKSLVDKFKQGIVITNSEEFKKIQYQLSIIQRQNELNSDVTTFIQNPKDKRQILYIVMSNDKTYVGKTEELGSVGMMAFEDGLPAHTPIYEKNGQHWVSGYAPIETLSGEQVAMIRLDYPVDAEIHSAKADLLKSLSFAAFIAFLIALIIGIFFGKTLSKSIQYLTDTSLRVASGDLEARVEKTGSDEIGFLGKTFNSMVSEIKKNRIELENYSLNLEIKVAARTTELKEVNTTISSMMNSLGQGFLIFNKEGICLPIHSKACEELLETNPDNKKIYHVLKNESPDLLDWIQMLFDEPLPFENLASVGPSFFDNSKGLSIGLEFIAIRNEDSLIENVMLIATDNTQKELALKNAENEKCYSHMIIQIVKNKNQFKTLIYESLSILEENLESIRNSLPEQLDIAKTYRFAHTFKGFVSLFSILPLKLKLQEVENLLSKKDNVYAAQTEAFKAELLDQIAETHKLFLEFIKDHESLFGDIYKTEQIVEISREKITIFKDNLISANISSKLLKLFSEFFIQEPLEKYFQHFNDVISQTARSLGKSINPILFSGGEISITIEPYKKLISSLVHVFRNSIDHGIEFPEERILYNKPSEGTIAVLFEKTNTTLIITITDDGIGIDPNIIRKKLAEKKYPHLDLENDDDMIQHIFDPGLTTKDQASEWSGRGVGMDVVKFETEALGGKVYATSRPHVYTKIVISIPFEKFDLT